MSNKSFTVHLAKQDVESAEEILTEKAQSKLLRPSTKIVVDEEFGDGATLYVFVGDANSPSWLSDLRQEFEIQGTVNTRSSCAVLVFKAAERVFAATFAHGWMYLKEENLESDFGLRVALNALDEKKLKRLDRANLADSLRGVDLSPFQREFKEFGIDDALDLVRKISGRAKTTSTAESLSGARSLKVTGEYSLSDLPDIAEEALQYYGSTDYRNTSFEIVDVVRPIIDKRLIRILDGISVDNIRTGQDSFELSLPVGYDDDDVGYHFKGPGLRGIFPDLLLRNYTSSLGDKLGELSIDKLISHRIIAEFATDGKPPQNSTIRAALVGSVVHEAGRYAINEGEWYRVDEAFKESIEIEYQKVLGEWENPPLPLTRLYDENGKGKYQIEADYNRAVSLTSDLVLLDKKLIQVPGVNGSGFESCDLLDIENKRFIHVKKSSRRSSVLSHFFKQGSNAAQNVVIFPSVSEKLLEIVIDEGGDESRDLLQASLADTGTKWTVEFWIADTPRANGDFNIPFFSKITLRDEVRRMHAMRYDVTLKFIKLAPIVT